MKINGNNRIKLVTFLTAVCLFLSTVEYAIPKPLPFMRLGLGNLPIIVGLSFLSPVEILLLTLFKIIGQAFVSGTLLSYVFVFSAGGSLASALCMLAVYSLFGKRKNQTGDKKLISFVGLSLCGALANNLVQLLLARFIMFGENAKYIAPLLLITGFVTGILIGIFAELFCRNSRWYTVVTGSKTVTTVTTDEQVGNVQPAGIADEQGIKAQKTKIAREQVIEIQKTRIARKQVAKVQKIGIVNIQAIIIFLVELIFFPVFLFTKNSVFLICEFVLITVLLTIKTLLTKSKFPNFVPSIFVFISIVFFSLLSPFGQILLSVGRFNITQGALESGIRRGIILCGTVFLSQLIISKDLKFPGKLGQMTAQIFVYLSLLTTTTRKTEKNDKLDKQKKHRPKFSLAVLINLIQKVDDKLLFAWNENNLR